jgi:hypothetical protein
MYLPAEVINALKELNNTVQQNVTIMIESLNESLQKDPQNIIRNFDYGSDYYGAASGLYWIKFISLRPVVDKINAAVRSSLNVK